MWFVFLLLCAAIYLVIGIIFSILYFFILVKSHYSRVLKDPFLEYAGLSVYRNGKIPTLIDNKEVLNSVRESFVDRWPCRHVKDFKSEAVASIFLWPSFIFLYLGEYVIHLMNKLFSWILCKSVKS